MRAAAHRNAYACCSRFNASKTGRRIAQQRRTSNFVPASDYITAKSSNLNKIEGFAREPLKSRIAFYKNDDAAALNCGGALRRIYNNYVLCASVSGLRSISACATAACDIATRYTGCAHSISSKARVIPPPAASVCTPAAAPRRNSNAP